MHINNLDKLVNKSISFHLIYDFERILWFYSDLISIFLIEPTENTNAYNIFRYHKHCLYKHKIKCIIQKSYDLCLI